MEPTPEEMAAITTIGHAADWAGLTGAAQTSWYGVVGIEATTRLRALAAVPQDEHDTMLSEWVIGADAVVPTSIQRSAASLLYSVCRLRCGVDKTAPERRADEEQKQRDADAKQALDLERARALTFAATSAAAKAQAAPPPYTGKKVKMATVADQGTDEELPILDDERIHKAYGAYKARLGDFPPPDVEPSLAQITCLDRVFKVGPPYVDFALWGPHGQRIEKRVRMQGVKIKPDGSIGVCEINGPVTFDDWCQCYSVFRTGAIMLEAILPVYLDAYSDLMKRYHERYGSKVWSLLYQADVRARLEQSERIRRLGAAALADGVAGCNFVPTMPWNWVWKELVNDDRFWKREYEEQAMLVLANTRRLDSMLDGDAAIGDGFNRRAQGLSAGLPPGNRRNDPADQFSDAPTARPKKAARTEPDRGPDGLFSKNRKGLGLCRAFQTGGCGAHKGGKCPNNAQYVHQCGKCLSSDHGATFCDRDGAAPTGKGKGKGKPKGRGRGRGR
jgi:hypothetical protein